MIIKEDDIEVKESIRDFFRIIFFREKGMRFLSVLIWCMFVVLFLLIGLFSAAIKIYFEVGL